MMKPYAALPLLAATVLLIASPPASSATGLLGAEGPVKERGWIEEKDEQTGILVHTMELTLHPQGEPRPALKHRLLPDEFDMLDGNAAIYYLKALGFLEQDPARDRLRQLYKSAADKARREGKPEGEAPPYGWLSMTPAELPLDEVKDFLKITSFQPQYMREAARRRTFDVDRNLREVENPIAYLLPEIQSMRELARMQALRCKVAIAEGRLDDALAILGQQYALGWHLGQDEFLVSNLVGIACASIAWDDALYLVQQPDAPNLYWAVASLPDPFIDCRRALAVERQLVYLQFKLLREVDDTLRPAGYWQDFITRLAPPFASFSRDFGMPWTVDDPESARALLVAFVAGAYPGAKRYLVEECGMDSQQVDAYPTAQVVFLAMVRFYDEARDDYFKWAHLPFWHARTRTHELDRLMRRRRAAWLGSVPATVFLPAVLAVGLPWRVSNSNWPCSRQSRQSASTGPPTMENCRPRSRTSPFPRRWNRLPASRSTISSTAATRSSTATKCPACATGSFCDSLPRRSETYRPRPWRETLHLQEICHVRRIKQGISNSAPRVRPWLADCHRVRKPCPCRGATRRGLRRRDGSTHDRRVDCGRRQDRHATARPA